MINAPRPVSNVMVSLLFALVVSRLPTILNIITMDRVSQPASLVPSLTVLTVQHVMQRFPSVRLAVTVPLIALLAPRADIFPSQDGVPASLVAQ